ncbi:Polygalacturonase [Dendrobium catenatum]|uniref:Polygalacturonase n=1 Tax=Dendrobium catenatum TaxID=906689 RepID=A0A2I0WNE5_9ASPA|nr:Polygalacturonase [Dendrobium catenatum]
MAKKLIMRFVTFFFLILSTTKSASMPSYNITDFGAKPDGLTDSAKPFLAAWSKACSSTKPASIFIPSGTFFLSRAEFSGPCKSVGMRIFAYGATVVASSDYGSAAATWITFRQVKGLSIYGGKFNGRGKPLWACKMAGGNCPTGAPSSGIKIIGVSFKNIMGTSATKIAVKLDCSESNPCSGIGLDNIDLTYGQKKMAAQSFCRNANGRSSGLVIPPSCF